MVLNECSRNVGSQVCNIDTDHKWIFLFLKRLVSTHWDNEFSSNSVMNWWNIAKWFVYWVRIREKNLRWNYKYWPVGIGAKLRLDRCNVFIRPPVFRHPPGWLKTENLFSFTPPLDFRQPPLNYRYCDTLHTMWQMNYRVCNKKSTVNVSACNKKSTVTVKVYRCWQHL